MGSKDDIDLRRRLLAFSGIGVQTLVIILLFYYLGSYLDGEDPESRWTLWMTLTGLVVSLYFLIKGLLSIFQD